MTARASGLGLVIDGLTVRFGERAVLDRLHLEIGPGEVVCLQGPSGSGKSTLLRVVAGLLPPDEGVVTWQGHDLSGVPVHKRHMAMVFQRHALFSHLDVAGNIAFGMRMARRPRAERVARVAELLDVVGLEGFGSRRVTELSGGEAQRVALARALAYRPPVLLLDEPLSSLDQELRVRLADDLARIVRSQGCSVLHVTHDPFEARRIGDRVVHLADGRIA